MCKRLIQAVLQQIFLRCPWITTRPDHSSSGADRLGEHPAQPPLCYRWAALTRATLMMTLAVGRSGGVGVGSHVRPLATLKCLRDTAVRAKLVRPILHFTTAF